MKKLGSPGIGGNFFIEGDFHIGAHPVWFSGKPLVCAICAGMGSTPLMVCVHGGNLPAAFTLALSACDEPDFLPQGGPLVALPNQFHWKLDVNSPIFCQGDAESWYL